MIQENSKILQKSIAWAGTMPSQMCNNNGISRKQGVSNIPKSTMVIVIAFVIRFCISSTLSWAYCLMI